jgi:hypothetical protein
MTSLSVSQQQILNQISDALCRVSGLKAVVLGGSHARGRAHPESDLDIGLYYRDAEPLDVQAIREIAMGFHDTPNPVVTGLGDWGPWVNGGAWLSVGGQRVDLLYRSLDQVEHTLSEAQAGRFEIHFEQQPPFGFFGPTLLGEVAIAQILWKTDAALSRLKAAVSPMPPALSRAVIQSRLWSIEFGLKAFAPKYVVTRNIYGFAGCLTRFSNALVLALFALNKTYLLNDKTSLVEISGFSKAPSDFAPRLEAALANIGNSPESMQRALDEMTALFLETKALVGDAYTPSFAI